MISFFEWQGTQISLHFDALWPENVANKLSREIITKSSVFVHVSLLFRKSEHFGFVGNVIPYITGNSHFMIMMSISSVSFFISMASFVFNP